MKAALTVAKAVEQVEALEAKRASLHDSIHDAIAAHSAVVAELKADIAEFGTLVAQM